jgi:hypothetical protein
MAIAAHYLARKAHQPDVTPEAVADLTAGYTPVRIERLLDEGLIVALRRSRTSMTLSDLVEAQLTVEIGLSHPVGYHRALGSPLRLKAVPQSRKKPVGECGRSARPALFILRQAIHEVLNHFVTRLSFLFCFELQRIDASFQQRNLARVAPLASIELGSNGCS